MIIKYRKKGWRRKGEGKEEEEEKKNENEVKKGEEIDEGKIEKM